MRSQRVRTVGDIALALALPAVVLPAMSTYTPSSAAALVPAEVPEPLRLAFTDDRDELNAVTVVRDLRVRPDLMESAYGVEMAATGPTDLGPEAAHTGEASASMDTPGYAYVSTVDEPNGEVYVVIGDEPPVRVTCNAAVESHPVLDPGAAIVAYASDVSGTFDIWMTELEVVNLEPCPFAEARHVTAGPARDLWPSWLDADRLVFSSDRVDALGDLFVANLPGRAPIPTSTPEPEAGVWQLTDGAAADTQPAARQFDINGVVRTWVAFSTTRWREDGSLAWFELPAVEAPAAVLPFWADADLPGEPSDDTVQSSEPAWTPDGREIAFTTTSFDPSGDVHLAAINIWADDAPFPRFVLTPSVPIAATPGVAESHPAWLTPFADNLAHFRMTAQLAFTTRSTDADISDVVGSDGSDRRTIATSMSAGPLPIELDEAEPSYSWDGSRLAYSRVTGDGRGRELVIADSDGSSADPLTYDRQPADVDLDPAWSPDGERIAFVRYAWNGVGYEDPAIWAVAVPTGVTYRVSQAAQAENLQLDEGPTWSPDGARLAFARRSVPIVDLAVSVDIPSPINVGDESTLAVTVSNNGPAVEANAHLAIALPSWLDYDLPASCDAPEATIRCDVGSVGIGERVRVDLTVQARAEGEGFVTAYTSASGYDAWSANDSSTEPVEADDPGSVITADMPLSAYALQAYRADPPDQAQPFSPPRPATSTVWTMDALDGTNAVALLEPASADCPEPCTRQITGRSPAWSPTGSLLAYEDMGALRVAELAGDDQPGPGVAEQVVDIITPTGFDNSGLATPARALLSGAEDPAWSPDETEIAFAGQPAGQPDQRGIYAIRPDGTGLREVAQLRQPETEPAYQPPPPPPAANVGVIVTLNRAEAWVGGESIVATFTVTNEGPDEAAGVSLTTGFPAFVHAPARVGSPSCAAGTGPCAVGTLAPGESRPLTATINLQAVETLASAPGVPPDTAPAVVAGAGEVTATVTTSTGDPDPSDNTAAASFTVLQPTIRLLPPIGRPGEVVLAYGENFPPGASVQLGWSRGITADTRAFTVDADGTFRRPVLVIRRDMLGARLVAGAPPVAAPRVFGPVDAPMLVVPRSVSPPAFVGRG